MNIEYLLEQGKDRNFLINSKETLSYKSVLEFCRREPNQDLSGKLCLFFFENSLEAIKSYIKLLYLNCTVLIINPDSKENYINQIICDYCPDFIGKKKSKSSSEEVFFSDKDFEICSYDYPNNKNISDKLQILLPTSGSTGNSKVVRISKSNLEFSSRKISQYFKLKSCDVVTSSLPLYYSYGLSLLNIAITSGCSFHICEFQFLSKSYWNQLNENHVTHFAGVPTMFKNIIEARALKLFPSTLNYITVAGGKLSEPYTINLIDYCEEKGIGFYTMYGATEASPRMSYVPPEMARKKLGSAGMPINDCHFEIEKINQGNEGEVIFYGKNVALGYSENRNDLTSKDSFKGRLNTGDLGYLDSDGYLYVTGRLKRIAKARGIRVNLDDIENLLSLNNINSMAVDYKDFIFIAIESDNEEEVEHIIENQSSIELGIVKIIQIEKFPLNDNMKKNYFALLEMIDHENR